jgi:superfamily II DNA or RNA helicase
MSLRDIKDIKLEYKTLSDNVIENFYLPCLRNATEYDRAVGFFSSSILIQISKGICSLAKRKGKMRLLISTVLSKEDEEAISKGYASRESLVGSEMEKSFEDPESLESKERLGLLSYLISSGVLDVKVVVVRSECDSAIYHEKLGIMIDDCGDKIVFSGSANESLHAFAINYEDIDVFASWSNDHDYERCFLKQTHFDSLWNGEDSKVDVLPFPEAVKNKLLRYRPLLSEEDPSGLDEKWEKEYFENAVKRKMPTSEAIRFFDFQSAAIAEWISNGGRGIFSMATGTGKTYTALGAVTELSKKQKPLFVLILCPYQHLVTQWENDCKTFNISPILGYGSSRKWAKKFERAETRIELRQSDFECAIMTNDSFMSEWVQKELSRNLSCTLLVADEAHNLGGSKIKLLLSANYGYRLALSATIERHGDPDGTKVLTDFFGKECINYPLDRAICEGRLSQYYYHPILVNLTDDELDRNLSLSAKIRKMSAGSPSSEWSDMGFGFRALLLKRARIIAGAEMKTQALKEAIKPFVGDHYMLVYCGAVSLEDSKDEDDETQIGQVIRMLGNDLGMAVGRFTSKEDALQRKDLKEALENQRLDALVAIRCLDEGVNIPAVRRAFILASSTNPKEYIQRRGRVLRLFSGGDKKYAEIFDFITITRPLGDLKFCSPDQIRKEASLPKREIDRVKEFSRLSLNPMESYNLINEITEAYNLNDFSIGGYDDGFDTR